MNVIKISIIQKFFIKVNYISHNNIKFFGGNNIKKVNLLALVTVSIVICATLPLVQSTAIDDTPPTITLVNPNKGYFHFSGIRLFPTFINIISDTMGFGGFRVRPVQVEVEDDTDLPEDLSVYMFVKDDEQGEMIWNSDEEIFERQWIGPDLGVFTVNISAEDTSENMNYLEFDVWYFCFIPE